MGILLPAAGGHGNDTAVQNAIQPLCIRLMLHVDTERTKAELRHVFLRGATALRPELAEPGDDQ